MAITPDELDDVPLFQSLPEDARRKFATWVSEVSVPEGKQLAEEGEYAYDLFIIKDGKAEVIQDGNTVAELGPGEFFGEMGVLERSQRNATVVATSPMLLVTLTGWDVRRLRKTAPRAVDHLRGVVAERREHA